VRIELRNGVVVGFDPDRGLGEIESDGTVYPFHCTQIADGTRIIPVGAKVGFAVAPGPLGRWEAVGIRAVACSG
jgi:CspA family cold shock protein